MVKAGDIRKHPHAPLAMAIAHAAHQAAHAAGQAAQMVSGSGADANPPLVGEAGDQINGGKKTTMKADAGKNGVGAGFEQGAGAGTDAEATADDKENTEVYAKPGKKTSGSDSGLPEKAKAKKEELIALAKAKLAKAQAKYELALAKAELTDVTTEEVEGAEPSDAESAGNDGESNAAEDRATADDAANAGGKVAGKVKGKTIDTAGIPDGAMASTTKNDGNADIGKKGKGNKLPDDQSGAGAEEKNVQAVKADDAVMKALQAISRSVQESIAAVTKNVADIGSRVDAVAVVAKKTDTALQGTLFNEAGGDRLARAQKSALTSAPPLLDTAFTRRPAA